LGRNTEPEIVGYDPVNKSIFSSGYQDDGSTWSGVVGFNGSTLTFTGRLLLAGKQYLIKATYLFAADFSSAKRSEEISADGKTWIPSSESTWTKLNETSAIK